MAITAAMVKELRELSGAGMMDCKKALIETEGDMDKAVEVLRLSGAAKADKKAGRVASEGLVAIESKGDYAAIVEVNCETDFAAKNPDFQALSIVVTRRVLESDPIDVDALLAMPAGDSGVDIAGAVQELMSKVGENMAVRRFARVVANDASLGIYLHKMGDVARIGAIVVMQGGDEKLAKDIAMHVAASRPQCVSPDEVPKDVIEAEKAIFVQQAAESGKPEEIIEKMVAGKLNKYLREITLLGQPFVKDPDITIEKLLKQHNATVASFIRYELGEGIEKKTDDFATEVMAAAQGN